MNGPVSSDLRVLSIQSHVVHGYVGNKCAQFTLQNAGFDVDTINSVQFSNHTGYGAWTGERLKSGQVWELYEGLCKNSLNDYTHILTGYIGSAASLREVARIVADSRSRNPSLRYVCDPVMGDNGKFYVSRDVLPVYKDELVPLADVVTPNQFELELITGLPVANEEQILVAMKSLHDRGVRKAVVTSLNAQEEETTLVGYGSQVASDNAIEVFRFEIPRIPAYFVGTGDLFTSLLLVWLDRCNESLMHALEKVLSSLQDVLKRTLEDAKRKRGDELLTSKDLELRLIQSRHDLSSPRSNVKIFRLNRQ